LEALFGGDAVARSGGFDVEFAEQGGAGSQGDADRSGRDSIDEFVVAGAGGGEEILVRAPELLPALPLSSSRSTPHRMGHHH
jgi:hypothetical protein